MTQEAAKAARGSGGVTLLAVLCMKGEWISRVGSRETGLVICFCVLLIIRQPLPLNCRHMFPAADRLKSIHICLFNLHIWPEFCFNLSSARQFFFSWPGHFLRLAAFPLTVPRVPISARSCDPSPLLFEIFLVEDYWLRSKVPHSRLARQ